MSPITPHAARVLVWLLLALALSLPVAGCGGCGDASIEEEETAEAELEKEKDKAQKKKEKPKQDFEDPKLHVYPQVPAPNRASLVVKPGHWNTAVEEMKANNFHFPEGELRATLESRTGGALAVEHTPFYVTTSRRAPLAKGVLKFFDVEYFVPVGTALPRMAVELRNERGGGLVLQNYEYFRLLGPHQYYIVVLSDTPDSYIGFRDLDSLAAPGFEGLTPDSRHYALVLPRVKKRVPLPTNSLSWTSIAYVIWDDLDPTTLDDDQQRAMLDWLHWGGQLIVSGPGSLDKLKGSFLDPPAPASSYLPAAAGESIKLSQEQIAEMAGPWTIAGNGGTSRRLVATSAWSAVELKLHPQGNYVPNAANQVAERRVGRGRIAVTSFRIRERNLRTWPCFDGFLNAVLLRREPRKFFHNGGTFLGPEGRHEVGVGWAKHAPAVNPGTQQMNPNPYAQGPNHMIDARLTTTLRYISRDLNHDGEFAARGEVSAATAFDPGGNFQGFATPGLPQPQPLAKEDGDESQTDDEGNALITGKVLPHGSGIGGWNDFDGVSAAARTSLRQAAGIRIPDGSFVLFVLTVYLAVLVPLNWLIFRTVGRIELAWIAAPLIAIAGAAGVIYLAQLDIGFVRSQTEVAVLEVHADYPRGHLTRYTALYSSLTTEYDLVFDDKNALAMPFATDPEFQLLRSQGLSPVNLYRDEEEARLSGYRVQSNSTSMVHSEQMADLGGVISYQEKDGRHEIFNRTKYSLTSVGVIRKVDDRMEAAYLGDLKDGGAAAVRFNTAPSQPPLLPQWVMTSTTDERDVPLTRLLKLAQESEQLESGEVRLVAVIKQSLPGLSVEPAASQNDRSATVVVAMLKRPSLASRPPQRDANSRYDISEKKYTGRGGAGPMSVEGGKPDRQTTARPDLRSPPRPAVAPPATVNGVPQANLTGDIPMATVAVVPAAKPAPPPPPMIELINFGKRYGDFTAVEQLNLRIPKGELYGFIGPNGAGKSTTIRFLATLLKASHGEGVVNGHSVTRDPLGVRRCVGYMPDNFGVYDGMRVWEFLDFFAVAYQIPKAKRKQVIGDVLELLDLTHKRDDFVNGLSRGMKQRLCLAKTLVHDPPLLILDEPSSGLDPRARMEFKALMKELRRMGKTILVSSHILSELADICTSIGIIERGQLLMHGPIEQVYRQIRRNRLVEIKFVEGMDVGLSIIRSHPATRSVTEDENRVTVELEGSDAVVAELLDQLVRQKVRIRSFADKDPTLEDVFMMVTKGIVA